MKSPALILFIIFNLLTINMAMANNMYDKETGESHLLQTQANAQDVTAAKCVDDASCDHSCHLSAHMVAVTSHVTSLSTVNTSMAVVMQDVAFYSLIPEPPSQPPRI